MRVRPIQGKRIEGRQKLPVQYAVLDLPRRLLQLGAPGRLPRPLRGYEPWEGRCPLRDPRNARGLEGEACPARLVRAFQHRRTECHPSGAGAADPAPQPSGAHPHPEDRNAGVPDGIFLLLRPQPRDIGVAQAHPPVGGIRVSERRRRLRMPQQPTITGTVSPRRSARLAWLCRRSCSRTSARPAHARTLHRKRRSALADTGPSLGWFGNTHTDLRGSPLSPGTARAGEDSQTILGPIMRHGLLPSGRRPHASARRMIIERTGRQWSTVAGTTSRETNHAYTSRRMIPTTGRPRNPGRHCIPDSAPISPDPGRLPEIRHRTASACPDAPTRRKETPVRQKRQTLHEKY